MCTNLRVGVVVAVVEVLLALTLNSTRSISGTQADQHHRVTGTVNGVHVSFINFTSGLVEVAIVDIFLRQWEHGFHTTSSKILRAHTHQA